MAFKDSNGKITIDEVAASNDIKNLNKSKENLECAIEKFKEVVSIATEFSGNTGTTIVETSSQMQKMLKEAVTKIETTADNINATVKKYQSIDTSIKDTINGTKV